MSSKLESLFNKVTSLKFPTLSNKNERQKTFQTGKNPSFQGQSEFFRIFTIDNLPAGKGQPYL